MHHLLHNVDQKLSRGKRKKWMFKAKQKYQITNLKFLKVIQQMNTYCGIVKLDDHVNIV